MLKIFNDANSLCIEENLEFREIFDVGVSKDDRWWLEDNKTLGFSLDKKLGFW